MTVNNKIIKALEPLRIPVTTDFNISNTDEYIVFFPADDRGVDFGDDSPEGVVQWMQIQYYCPIDKNYIQTKVQIRGLLMAAGFTYPSVEVDTDREMGYTRLIFECSIHDEEAV